MKKLVFELCSNPGLINQSCEESGPETQFNDKF